MLGRREDRPGSDLGVPERRREHLSPNGRVLLLISSDVDGDLWRRATEGWAKEELASGTFFFERLTVLKLTL